MTDGSAWWRVLGPMVALRASTQHLGLITMDLRVMGPQYPLIALSQAVLINRPYGGLHLAVVDTANVSGIPTIVDFDDLLWDIPRWNAASETYGEAERTTAQIAATRARVVIASTQAIADHITGRCAPDADVRVIPNALPDHYTWSTTKRQKIVLYRGGDGHMGDLRPAAEDIAATLVDRPDWQLVTVGTNPYWLHDMLPAGRSTHVPRQFLTVFHAWLRGSSAAVMVVPLRDHPFNRAKSNIAWLEGTYAGAAVLAPDFPEFRRPGCTNYTDFRRDLGALMDAPQEHRGQLVSASREYVDDCLRHRHVNRARAEILAEMLR